MRPWRRFGVGRCTTPDGRGIIRGCFDAERGHQKSEVSRICAGADRYERTETRITDRNGSRPRLLATQAGDVELRIPKLRKGSFFPVILEPRRRSDQALYAVVMEAYVNGVSTRAVDDLSTPASRLQGTQLVISDQHSGLIAALRRILQGLVHQRCRVHFARNLLALVPKSHKDMVAAVFRTIFAQPDAATVANTWDSVRDQLAAAFPKIGPLMDEAKTEVLAFAGFPRSHWPKVWSTNPLERVNKEIKRRARVVGIFPNEPAVIRLVGAILADSSCPRNLSLE
jgi:transposase-like protein